MYRLWGPDATVDFVVELGFSALTGFVSSVGSLPPDVSALLDQVFQCLNRLCIFCGLGVADADLGVTTRFSALTGFVSSVGFV